MPIQNIGQTHIQTETKETGEIRESTKRKQWVYARLRPATLALVLSVLAACSKAPEPVVPVVPPHPGIAELEQSDDMELSRLKSQYNSVIESIRKKYGIIVKIAEQSDFPNLAHHSQKASDYLYFVKKIDHQKIKQLLEFTQQIYIQFEKYSPSYLKQVRHIFLVDRLYLFRGNKSRKIIDSEKPAKEMWWFATSLGDITLWLNQWGAFSLFMAKEWLDHELQHTVHMQKNEHWPFEEENDDSLWDHESISWFARWYGKTDLYEDAATVSEEVMDFVRQQLPRNDAQWKVTTSAIQIDVWDTVWDWNQVNHKKTDKRSRVVLDSPMKIRERMMSDYILANKVMYVTWCYFDRKEWKFLWDFSIVGFRHFFHDKDIKELPFYARMRERGKYDHEFWNKAFGFGMTSE